MQISALESERQELENEKRTKLLEKEIERLAALESRLDALVAQCRFLLSDTSRNRLQLNEALAVLIDEIKPSES